MSVDIGLIAVGNETRIKTIKTISSTQSVIKYNYITSKYHKLWMQLQVYYVKRLVARSKPIPRLLCLPVTELD